MRRRPPGVREPLDPFVAEVDPTVPLNLDIDILLQSLRKERCSSGTVWHDHGAFEDSVG